MTIEPQLQASGGSRMAECYRRDLPSENEIRRARQRFERRGVIVRQVTPKLLLAFVVQGFVLGVVTLAAASWVAERVLPAREPPARSLVIDRNTRESSASSGKAAARRAPSEEPGTAELSPPRAAFPDIPVDSDLVRSEPARPSGKALDPKPESVAPADGPWGRVARALSASDWNAADSALRELGASPDPGTRDAADSARAQLFIARGQGEAFRATVERLARSGQTPLIRRRAAGLLEQLR